MHKIVKEVLTNKIMSDKEKIAELNKILTDSQKALEILNGEWKFCSECKEYYKAKSFYSESEVVKKNVCTYEDPINSGGDEYEEKTFREHYIICPKGHKEVVFSEEIK